MNAFRVEVGKRKFYRDEACAAFHFLVALPVFSIEIKRKEKRMKKCCLLAVRKLAKKGAELENLHCFSIQFNTHRNIDNK
jgi:hypothetical protein